MALTDIDINIQYRSDANDLINDFYIPCLSNSTKYCRSVGFFTSAALAECAKGIYPFIKNGGTIRIVASPQLNEKDLEAFKKGYTERDALITKALFAQISEESLNLLNDFQRRRFDCITWLIKHGKLELKLALPVDNISDNNNGIYHEKVGIFSDDDNNIIATNGSVNETRQGYTDNFESFVVFKSWASEYEANQVTIHQNNFDRLWDNQTARLNIHNFPEAVRQKLISLSPEQPPVVDVPPVDATPDLPHAFEPRGYQLAASNAWFNNGCRGIFAMATGTGKTVTALATAVRLIKEESRAFIVVACPYIHLVDQWEDEAKKFGFRPHLGYESTSSWIEQVTNSVVDYNLGNASHRMIITTHTTLASPIMQETLHRLNPNSGPLMLIADEAHHLGSEHGLGSLPYNFDKRLGLSATPDRWNDDLGTQALYDYFGDTVFELSIDEAIKQGFLCRYMYYPKVVDLTDEELSEYELLITKLSELGPTAIYTHSGKSLLSQLSELGNKARKKLDALRELLQVGSDIEHALFYTVPSQIDEILSVLGNEFGVRVHSFTARETREERARLLDSFDSGELQGLVAMRCLDEGVDVPSTRTAYILASSENPRQFIQRRGRVLRKFPGKSSAIIHDLITAPPLQTNQLWRNNSDAFNMERNLLRSELKRFTEFSDSCENKYAAKERLVELAKRYNLLDEL